jgi:3'-phosphoadenosine 5'-phosphosulfate sulfotransferase (PAPS reductase)/FAD synthetase
MRMEKIVAWFSAGVSSAVAIKLAIESHGVDEIYYIHINDQHEDSRRFIADCASKWFGMPVIELQSPFKTVDEVCRAKRYINGVAGAPCTKVLKKQVRTQWEYEQPLDTKITYVWGMDYEERKRAERLLITMPNQQHLFPLIDRKMTKQQAHEVLKASGLQRPLMYELGFKNNNCLGCVKASSAAYWNLIRKYYPDVFASRCQLEDDIGATMINGIKLKHLDPEAGRGLEPIVDDCGILCEVMAI